MSIVSTAESDDGSRSHGGQPQPALVTLTQAAKLAPGRPTPNCIWRWCRKGVLARSGARIKLQHLRMGGKIFTSTSWLAEFGAQLAAADASHFDKQFSDDDSVRVDGKSPAERARAAHLQQVDRELEEHGL